MESISTGLKILVFSVATLVISVGYYVYALSVYPPIEENETFLSEIGKELGGIGLWLLVFIDSTTFATSLVIASGANSYRKLSALSTRSSTSITN